MTVAEELHFRRAADRLNVAQSAVTRSIRLLEDDIGVPLFHRSTRKVQLTQTGAVFLEGCLKIDASIKETIEHTRQSINGEVATLSIGYTDFAINDELPDIINGFRKQYPGISIELRHGFTESQLADLQRGKLDFGFLTGPIQQPNITTYEVKSNAFIVVLPEFHHLASQPCISLKSLADEPFVLGNDEDWKYYHTHLYRLCRAHGFIPQTTQRAFNTEGIFGLVASGMGISIQLQCMANYIRKGLTIKPLDAVNDTVPTVAAWTKQSVTPARQRFISYLRKHTKANV